MSLMTPSGSGSSGGGMPSLNQAMRMGPAAHASYVRAEQHSIRTASEGTRSSRQKASGRTNNSPHQPK